MTTCVCVLCTYIQYYRPFTNFAKLNARVNCRTTLVRRPAIYPTQSARHKVASTAHNYVTKSGYGATVPTFILHKRHGMPTPDFSELTFVSFVNVFFPF